MKIDKLPAHLKHRTCTLEVTLDQPKGRTAQSMDLQQQSTDVTGSFKKDFTLIQNSLSVQTVASCVCGLAIFKKKAAYLIVTSKHINKWVVYHKDLSAPQYLYSQLLGHSTLLQDIYTCTLIQVKKLPVLSMRTCHLSVTFSPVTSVQYAVAVLTTIVQPSNLHKPVRYNHLLYHVNLQYI